MKPIHPRNAGLNLIELQITIAILAIVLVVAALSVYGLSWSALKMIVGVPLGFLAFSVLLSAGVQGGAKILELRTALRVRHVLALAREGSPAAEQSARALPYGWGTDAQLAKRRDELVSLLVAPASRFAALVLLVKAQDRHPPEADAALLAGAGEWPDDLLLETWRLTRKEPARLAIASVFLRRASEATRTRLLADMFATYSPSRVPDLTEEWQRVLAPYAAEIAALPKGSSHHTASHVDVARVAAYGAAFEATTRNG